MSSSSFLLPSFPPFLFSFFLTSKGSVSKIILENITREVPHQMGWEEMREVRRPGWASTLSHMHARGPLCRGCPLSVCLPQWGSGGPLFREDGLLPGQCWWELRFQLLLWVPEVIQSCRYPQLLSSPLVLPQYLGRGKDWRWHQFLSKPIHQFWFHIPKHLVQERLVKWDLEWGYIWNVIINPCVFNTHFTPKSVL